MLCTWFNNCFCQKRKQRWICLSLLIMCTGMCTCNTPTLCGEMWKIPHLSARCVATDPAIHHTHKGYIFWLSDVSHSGISNHDKSRLSTMSCSFAFSFVLALWLLQWQWRVGETKTGHIRCLSLFFLFVFMVTRQLSAFVFGFIHTLWASVYDHTAHHFYL